MDILHTLESDTFSPAQKREALAALENGKVIYFPKLTFELTEDEKSLLTPTLSDGKAKNISMDPNGRIQHSAAQGAQRELLTG
ncbi:MAG TPA: Kdo hydroxylase family protein, partial [Rhizomicrobium sp.]|nr:Kdo hydroxylase family protein [Rhizomicrobium sp.]